mmetsp:Transcript_56355/g.132811  ORF Transcript_56355/g.132811 Transcript_56355/m.132811 type:complete len:210 (+) Transcript_56355:180-809(+)
MVEVEEDMVRLSTDAATLTDLDGHGARDNVTRRQVLGGGSVALHEAFAVLVAEDAAFAARALGDETSGPVDTCGVELHKLKVLQGETRASNHGVAVSGAGVRGGCREVGTAVAPGGDNGVVGTEAVECTILETECHDSNTATPVHDEVERKILDEKFGIVSQGLAVERVEHGMTGAVGDARTAVRLPTSSVVKRLASESTLVNLAFIRP